MRRGPSLKRRLLLAFVACFLTASAALILALTAVYQTRHLGVETAVAGLALDLRRGPEGALELGKGPDFSARLRRSPGMWFVVRDADGRTLTGGSAPAEARTLLEALPPPEFTGEETLNFTAGDGRPATAGWEETEVGPVSLVLGGVSTGEMSGLEWALALTAVAVFVLLALALVFLVLGLVILPLVLSALRRLAAASAGLDGADLARRLPENGVVSELRPVVRAFNTALDRVEAASHRRDRLIADIAHELRTPLAVLTLRSETLPDGPPAAEVRRGLARLTQLIAQMLDAERLGAADRRREAVDLVELARGAVADIAPLALAEGYQLAFEAEPERLSVDGDRAAIGRAIGNLLGNAVAHGGGAGVIQVRVRAPGVVEVEDAGVGLPEGAHQRVFEPFHRERWDKDGCGLGLHLVREVMHAHGGRAEAADGASGALFRLIFPAAPA